LLAVLARAGGRAYSNFAVGINNVDVASASRLGIAVGNTPGVLTEATAELAMALTLGAARRLAEGDALMRAGRFAGWEPGFMIGEGLRGKSLGIVGAGRIGTAYARMMVRSFGMNVAYWSRSSSDRVEQLVADYSVYAARCGESPVTSRRVHALEDLLGHADVVSLHVPLSPDTRHLIDSGRLQKMKENAILVNTSRGPIVDEEALVRHCQRHPRFRVGLDVFEDEPATKPGLTELPNVVLTPHIGSATTGARNAMAQLAAMNLSAVLNGWPVWAGEDTRVFMGQSPPLAAPSIVNRLQLGLPGTR
jgi:hydroxypyruvate reductase 1